jgi:hypothetical protein
MGSQLRQLALAGGVLALSAAIAWRTEALAVGGPALSDPTQVGRLVSALNDCIQKRFKEIDTRFGMRRVIRIWETPHTFKPEQASEFAAVQDLQRATLRVVLYLAGRRVQLPTPDTSTWSPGQAWSLIKGPVAITPPVDTPGRAGSPVSLSPPGGLELWDESRRAFQIFATTDTHEFQLGAWRFIAKPVRAVDPACLECHREPVRASSRAATSRPLQLGDPLGVVLYGYQPR